MQRVETFAGAACSCRHLGLRQPLNQNIIGSYTTRQSGLPDVASRSFDDGAKSGSPPEIAICISWSAALGTSL
jgi:hypothetical protein